MVLDLCFYFQVKENSHYLKFRPPFLIFLHPALGPLWEIIRQKVLFIVSVPKSCALTNVIIHNRCIIFIFFKLQIDCSLLAAPLLRGQNYNWRLLNFSGVMSR